MDRFWGVFSSRPTYNFPNKEKQPVVNKKWQWTKFVVVLLLYLLFLYWLSSWMGLIVVPFIFDAYITKKINWQWWRQKENPTRLIMSWVDALVFALVAVYFINQFFFQNYVIPTSSLEKSLLTGDYLFVSKVSYGPRIPQTPLTLPLTQNTVGLIGCKSYIEWPQWEYRRAKGLGTVQLNDIVVFNYPGGDTVLLGKQYEGQDYNLICYQMGRQAFSNLPNLDSLPPLERLRVYSHIRAEGRRMVEMNEVEFGTINTRPTDRRDNYVKRCVGLPGQTLQIKDRIIYLDGKANKEPDNVQYSYLVKLKRYPTDEELLDMQITMENLADWHKSGGFIMTNRTAELMKKRKDLCEVIEPFPEVESEDIYPQNGNYHWTRDNYGPVWIPKKGESIRLTLENLPIYERPIRTYEGNDLEIRNGKIVINGQEATSYTFKMDYYWMMGDNRHNSLDSRYWGFVPEDHIVGKPIFIWWSSDPDRSGFAGIRWSRLFSCVDDIK